MVENHFSRLISNSQKSKQEGQTNYVDITGLECKYVNDETFWLILWVKD